jgi:hypothetical protein
MEAQAALGTLIRLPGLRLAGEVEWHCSSVLRSIRSLPVAYGGEGR